MTRIQSILGALEQIRRIIERPDPTCSVTIQKLNVLIVSIQVSLQRGILHLVWGENAQADTLFWNKSRGRLGQMFFPLLIGCILIVDRYSLSASTPGATNVALMLLKVLGNCDACTKLIGDLK